MRLSFAPAIALIAAAAVAGCATGGGKQRLAANPAVTSSSAGTLESSDPRLSAALLALKLLPSAEGHLQVAREYARLGVLDFAYRHATRALDQQPQLAPAHELMARIWRDWGQPDVALAHAHRAVYYAPLSASAQNTLGTIFDALQRFDDARRAFARAHELDPAASWALSNLCYLEFRQGNFDEARRQCEAALRGDPELAEAHNNLALAHAAAGDLAGAREAFLAAGDEAAAYYNLGIVLLATGRYGDAARSFEAAVTMKPTFTAAKTRAHEARMRELKADERKEP